MRMKHTPLVPHDAQSYRQDLVQTLLEGLDQWADALNEGWQQDDQAGHFGPSRWEAAVQAGLTSLINDENSGGLDLSVAELADVLEHLGYLCEDAGLGFSLATHLCSTCLPVRIFGSDILRAELMEDLSSAARVGAHAITEPHSGSDAFAMKTYAVREGDDYLLSGEKCFISNAPIADICVIYARTHPTKGALGGFSAFAVDCKSKGFQIGKPRKKMGLRTAPMADLYLDDVRVPATRLIGREGQGFSILDYVMRWEILSVFAIQLGEMRRQLERCITYAKERQQFGAPIGSYQAISHRIADMHLRLQSARNWLFRMVVALDKGGQATLEFSAAKLAISEAHVANSIDAITLHGGAGYMAETGIESHLRNAVGGLIYSGSSDIQKNRIAAMLGL
ncbi:acyl-CoA dehydrogenase family protein [Aliiroseovarius crassostreae]|uniref:acyl-CoA dehydrogenase family protein n=1 Tax=Aliiroseovarius crassostreae TaxID=154981 RepID=UPI0021B05EFF|nr:acyl-CoA dehydrogenase family protein [Aliiroseovarius crassostreae]UWP90864.1 acyl-CoA dehydrogenase family protein [Aliiroseovarius crassostreae]